ncbi:hypothetical protein Bwad002_30420 [Bilophila wadsworthia]
MAWWGVFWGFDMAIEPVVKAVISGDIAARTALAQLLSISTINTVYSAYSFYQARKGEALTPEEMKEIKDNVVEETNELTGLLIEHLNSCFSSSLDSMN